MASRKGDSEPDFEKYSKGVETDWRVTPKVLNFIAATGNPPFRGLQVPSFITTHHFAGDLHVPIPKDHKKHIEQNLKGVFNTAHGIKLKKDVQLPWELDRDCKLYSTEVDQLDFKINWLKKQLGLKPAEGIVYDKDRQAKNSTSNGLYNGTLPDETATALLFGCSVKLFDLLTEQALMKAESKFRTRLINWMKGEGKNSEYELCYWVKKSPPVGVEVPELIERGREKEAEEILKERKKIFHKNPGLNYGVIESSDMLVLKQRTFLNHLYRKPPMTEEEHYLWYKYIILNQPVNTDYQFLDSYWNKIQKAFTDGMRASVLPIPERAAEEVTQAFYSLPASEEAKKEVFEQSKLSNTKDEEIKEYFENVMKDPKINPPKDTLDIEFKGEKKRLEKLQKKYSKMPWWEKFMTKFQDQLVKPYTNKEGLEMYRKALDEAEKKAKKHEDKIVKTFFDATDTRQVITGGEASDKNIDSVINVGPFFMAPADFENKEEETQTKKENPSDPHNPPTPRRKMKKSKVKALFSTEFPVRKVLEKVEQNITSRENELVPIEIKTPGIQKVVSDKMKTGVHELFKHATKEFEKDRETFFNKISTIVSGLVEKSFGHVFHPSHGYDTIAYTRREHNKLIESIVSPAAQATYNNFFDLVSKKTGLSLEQTLSEIQNSKDASVLREKLYEFTSRLPPEVLSKKEQKTIREIYAVIGEPQVMHELDKLRNWSTTYRQEMDEVVKQLGLKSWDDYKYKSDENTVDFWKTYFNERFPSAWHDLHKLDPKNPAMPQLHVQGWLETIIDATTDFAKIGAVGVGVSGLYAATQIIQHSGFYGTETLTPPQAELLATAATQAIETVFSSQGVQAIPLWLMSAIGITTATNFAGIAGKLIPFLQGYFLSVPKNYLPFAAYSRATLGQLMKTRLIM